MSNRYTEPANRNESAGPGKGENTGKPRIPGLTTEIVSAYVSHHRIATSDVGQLISEVGSALSGLGRVPAEPTKPEPAVSVRRSVRPDHLVCLVCGKPFKSLRRHLRTAHDLSPAAYRERFELARDYPMVAAASTAQRAEIARRNGLGRRQSPQAAPEPAPEPSPESSPVSSPEPANETPAGRGAKSKKSGAAAKPVRGRRATKKTEGAPT